MTGFLRRNLWPLAATIIVFAAQLLPALARRKQLLDLRHTKEPVLPSDTDIWLYLTQTREWMRGWSNGGFFDHTVHNTNMPFAPVAAHWTRPMEALLALAAKLAPGASLDMHLLMAANFLPMVLCLLAFAALVFAARRHFRHGAVTIIIALLMLFDPEIDKNFTPGNADHHGLLCMLWCGVLYLLLDRRLTIWRASLMGVLLGLLVWTGIEGLVMIGFVLGVLGLEALLRPERTRLLAATAGGAALVTTDALLVEYPSGRIFEQHYDSLSIAHVALLWLTAAGAAVLTALFSSGRLALRGRIVAAGAVGAGVLLGTALLYPKLFLGVLVDADPFVAGGFFPNVGEMKPLFVLPLREILEQLAVPGMAVALLAVAWTRRCRERLHSPQDPRWEKTRRLFLLSALLTGTFLCTAVANRWAYYMHPVAMIAVAALAPGVLAGILPFGLRALRGYAAPALAWAVSAVTPLLFPLTVPDVNWCMGQVRYVIDSGQLQPLLGDKNLNLFTPSNMAGDVLFFTPYHVIATNLHREGKQLHDLRLIETAKSPKELEDLLRQKKTDAMLFCPVRTWPDTTLHKMMDRKNWPDWVAPVEGLHFLDEPGSKPLLLRLKAKHGR